VEVQADLKPLTEEQWEEVQERRPRTAFETKNRPLSCSHPDWRTVEPGHLFACIYLVACLCS
jgi:hypothetical protein